MWMIVGLGNPGSQYSRTRHNIGFLAIEEFARLCRQAAPAKEESKAHVSRFKMAGADEQVLLVEPQTFMNLSGQAVVPLMNYYKIELDHLLVVHDDVDLPPFQMKFQKNRGSGGNNGVKSVSELLGTQDYARLKLGIGRPSIPTMDTADYVLQKFSSAEAPLLQSFLERAAAGIESFVLQGFVKTANVFNQNKE